MRSVGFPSTHFLHKQRESLQCHLDNGRFFDDAMFMFPYTVHASVSESKISETTTDLRDTKSNALRVSNVLAVVWNGTRLTEITTMIFVGNRNTEDKFYNHTAGTFGRFTRTERHQLTVWFCRNALLSFQTQGCLIYRTRSRDTSHQKKICCKSHHTKTKSYR